MLGHTGFNKFLATLLSGALLMPLVLWLGLALAFGWQLPEILLGLAELGQLFEDYTVYVSAAAAALTLLLGVLLDATGHLTVDKIPSLDRSRTISEMQLSLAERQGFPNASPARIRQRYLAIVPTHIFSYQDEQWAYFETYRSVFVTSLLYLALGEILLLENGLWGPLIIWLASWFAAAWASWEMMFMAVKYYHKLEVDLVIGALMAESPKATHTSAISITADAKIVVTIQRVSP